MSVKQKASNGLKLLIKDKEPFSEVQASWRSLNNNVTIDDLIHLTHRSKT